MKPRVRVVHLDFLPPGSRPWIEVYSDDGISAVGLTAESAFHKWQAERNAALTPLARAWQAFVECCADGRDEEARALYQRSGGFGGKS
jgi:hypothetical protein